MPMRSWRKKIVLPNVSHCKTIITMNIGESASNANKAHTISNTRFPRRTESDGVLTEKSDTIAALSVGDTAVDKVGIRESVVRLGTLNGAVFLLNGGCHVLL